MLHLPHQQRAVETDRAVREEPPIVAGDWTFTYAAPKLTITNQAGGKPIVKTFAQLTGVKPAKPNPTRDDYCGPDREYLLAVAIDAATGTALVEFDWNTGHNCGSSGQAYGVIALPLLGPR